MSLRVVVLADTHMPRRSRELPAELCTALRAADHIIHLGDFTETRVLHELRSYGPVSAVYGNNDSVELRNFLPSQEIVTLAGHRILLIHGDIGGRTAREAARRASDEVDAVLFGHSHQPYCSQENGRLLFNPGSPTDRRTAPTRSYGVLTIGSDIGAEIVPLH